jgi:hypothetical protein
MKVLLSAFAIGLVCHRVRDTVLPPVAVSIRSPGLQSRRSLLLVQEKVRLSTAAGGD